MHMPDELDVVTRGKEHIIKVPYKDGRVYFSFSEISRAHQSFTTSVFVFIQSDTDGMSDEYRQRLDIQSHSAVESFRRSLQNAFDEKSIKWAIVINKAINTLVKAFNKTQQPVNFSGRECEESSFLFMPFLQKDTNNMVFGDSEVGKSYFCLRLAASLATGEAFMGLKPDGGKKTLFLDYEDSDTVFNRRMFEIASGMGIDKSTLDTHIWWYKPDGSIRDLIEVVSRMVEKYQFDLIVIDAGSNAAGGSPNDEQKVVDMFNALEQIPCTKLIIHHEPKENMGKADNKAYYGTVFWRALTRIAWRLAIENEEDGKLIKAVIAKKSNMGKVDPFFYRQKWEIPDLGSNFGAVTLQREVIEVAHTVEEAIMERLSNQPDLTKGQLATMTGLDDNSVKVALQRLRKRRVVDVKGSKQSSVWFLK